MKIQIKKSVVCYNYEIYKNKFPAPVGHKPLRWSIWELGPGFLFNIGA